MQKPDSEWNVADICVQPWCWCDALLCVFGWWLEDCGACQSSSLGSWQDPTSSVWYTNI